MRSRPGASCSMTTHCTLRDTGALQSARNAIIEQRHAPEVQEQCLDAHGQPDAGWYVNVIPEAARGIHDGGAPGTACQQRRDHEIEVSEGMLHHAQWLRLDLRLVQELSGEGARGA